MLISVLLVTRNEEAYILNCIKSIEDQFDSVDDWELIIVDGMSSDETINIINKHLSNAKYKYSIHHNSQKILASGWNMAIKKSASEFVIRPDAHAILRENYIKNGLEILRNNSKITAVGGILETKSNSFIGGVIKEALSSRVGVGDSSFRTAKKSGYYDTAVYAIYKKSIFDKVGYFNEKLVRHQDTEMHQRIRSAGGGFYMSTEMRADYYCRDTLHEIILQMYRIGRYLPDLLGTGSLRYRHFAPFVFFSTVLISILISIIFESYYIFISMALLLIYVSIILINSLFLMSIKKNVFILLNVILIPMMHFSYFVGFCLGLLNVAKISFRD